MFAKRHYEFIADVIARMPTHAPSLRAQQASCANAFATAFSFAEPRFKADKFLKACRLAADDRA